MNQLYGKAGTSVGRSSKWGKMSPNGPKHYTQNQSQQIWKTFILLDWASKTWLKQHRILCLKMERASKMWPKTWRNLCLKMYLLNVIRHWIWCHSPTLFPGSFGFLNQNPRYPGREVERHSQNLQLKFLRGACLLF